MKLVFTILLYFNITIIFSQNLVVNSGFEIFESKNLLNNILIKDVKYWKKYSNDGTNFFYLLENNKEKWGEDSIFIYSGNVSANIKVISNDCSGCPETRGYLKGTLKNELIIGAKYKISFFYKPSSVFNFCIKNLGIKFIDTSFIFKSTHNLIIENPDTIINTCNSIDTLNGWKFTEFNFISKNNNRYFILGNFNNNKLSKVNVFDYFDMNLLNVSYGDYFIDNVSIVKISK